jgi:hypothetical protein
VKRLRRIAFNFLSAVLAALCAATIVLWVRSYHVADLASCGDVRFIASGNVPPSWFEDQWELHGSSAGDGWLYAHFALERAEIRKNPKDIRESAGFWHCCGHDQPSTEMGNYLPGQWWHGFVLWLECGTPTKFRGLDFRVISGWSIWIGAPAWFVAPLLAILPLLWLRTFAKRAKRNKAGCCMACGYNLTGNISGLCPECGNKVPPCYGS